MSLENGIWLAVATVFVAIASLIIYAHRRTARGQPESEGHRERDRTASAPRAQPLHIGGRQFRALTVTTLEHDLWFQAHVRRAGLSGIPLEHDETAEEYAHRALARLCESPESLELIGALILPAEIRKENWTPAVARETAGFLARLTDPEDKLEVRRLMLSLLVPFLESGLASLKSFGSLSDRGVVAAEPGARGPANVLANGVA